jgi:hypothetical protein
MKLLTLNREGSQGNVLRRSARISKRNRFAVEERGIISILLFLDEKKQKSFDRTELAKNPKLTLKCFNSAPISNVG